MVSGGPRYTQTLGPLLAGVISGHYPQPIFRNLLPLELLERSIDQGQPARELRPQRFEVAHRIILHRHQVGTKTVS